MKKRGNDYLLATRVGFIFILLLVLFILPLASAYHEWIRDASLDNSNNNDDIGGYFPTRCSDPQPSYVSCLTPQDPTSIPRGGISGPSGITASRVTGLYWIVPGKYGGDRDSGGSQNHIYLYDNKGGKKWYYTLKKQIKNPDGTTAYQDVCNGGFCNGKGDWEAISSWTNPKTLKRELVIGDIGDDCASDKRRTDRDAQGRPVYRLYKVLEPDPNKKAADGTRLIISGVYEFVYPGSYQPNEDTMMNAESLFIDENGVPHIIIKTRIESCAIYNNPIDGDVCMQINPPRECKKIQESYDAQGAKALVFKFPVSLTTASSPTAPKRYELQYVTTFEYIVPSAIIIDSMFNGRDIARNLRPVGPIGPITDAARSSDGKRLVLISRIGEKACKEDNMNTPNLRENEVQRPDPIYVFEGDGTTKSFFSSTQAPKVVAFNHKGEGVTFDNQGNLYDLVMVEENNENPHMIRVDKSKYENVIPHCKISLITAGAAKERDEAIERRDASPYPNNIPILGDNDGSGNNPGSVILSISDSIRLLNSIRDGTTFSCIGKEDINLDAATNAGDAIYLLRNLFRGDSRFDSFPESGYLGLC